jgi:hypothetical protein
MRFPGRGPLLGVVCGAALGVGVGFLVWSGDDRTSESAATQIPTDTRAETRSELVQQQLHELRARLDREVQRREALERRLAEATPVEPAAGNSTDAGASGAAAEKGHPQVGEHWVDAEILTRAGFSPSETDELRARFEAIELDRLYLRDQATREGWVGRPRYAKQLRELDARYGSMREDYGDDAYDWILYASGQQNRVVVRRVMTGSEAAEAGFEDGDVVVSYDDERIYDASSLQQATVGGESGRTTVVEVERGGERRRLFPARGPLGITLISEREEPGEPLR